MGKLTGKDKHKVIEGSHSHTDLSKVATVRGVQMQEMGIASEIKRPAI